MGNPDDRRPSPDALLTLAERERRGRLKIFLGASPGVGKTYAMLSGAQRLKGEGKDVIIGVVETHSRQETVALLAGLETLPRRSHSYKGRMIEEFDLDAALQRRPDLIIVDELAHSNPPDARHPKRYQDVEELIEAGIDVWTALNIQHIESLSDVVSTITGVKVRELVPDTVVEHADDVVLVDITPDELIQRLKSGKVYLPDNARRAAENFLQVGNITALRELALRRTTQRVGDQMVDYLRQKAIEGPWPTADRIMVCVGSDEMAEEVVREAARLANGLNAPWLAVHVAFAHAMTDPTRLQPVENALVLAERLGATIVRQSSDDISEDVIKLARRENVTQIIVGRADPGFWKRISGKSLPDAILQQADGIAVHVLARRQAERRWRLPRIEPNLQGFAVAFITVSIASLVGWSISHLVELPNISMIFLTAVLVTAVSYGTTAAVAASALSFLAYNFLFIEPKYTFTVARPHELLALFIFLLVAVLTGSLAGRVREQTKAALDRVRQVESLLDISRKLSSAVQTDDLLWVVATQAAAIIQGHSIVMLRRNDDIQIAASMPPEDSIGPADWAAARWSVNHAESAGWNTATLPNALFQFQPLKTPNTVIGALGIKPAAGRLSDDVRRMLESLVEQSSLALERTRLSAEASDARAAAEGEKLRSALLSSISHDLRTPLSAIVGSISALRSLGRKMPVADRDDLLRNIEDEARRLTRFVNNLLDMTKLESGGVEARRERLDLCEVAAATVHRARQQLPSRKIVLELPADPVPVFADSALIDQLLSNLIENADKYGGLTSTIRISVARENEKVHLSVEDEGPGIPEQDLEKVFEKFYRVRGDDGRPAGTGLGLAICRAITAAMKGSIVAQSPIKFGLGTRFLVTLPLAP
jgi:two-component system sensor histidine kinase KdpD